MINAKTKRRKQNSEGKYKMDRGPSRREGVQGEGLHVTVRGEEGRLRADRSFRAASVTTCASFCPKMRAVFMCSYMFCLPDVFPFA